MAGSDRSIIPFTNLQERLVSDFFDVVATCVWPTTLIRRCLCAERTDLTGFAPGVISPPMEKSQQ
jgi:hypothetical protein